MTSNTFIIEGLTLAHLILIGLLDQIKLSALCIEVRVMQAADKQKNQTAGTIWSLRFLQFQPMTPTNLVSNFTLLLTILLFKKKHVFLDDSAVFFFCFTVEKIC
jgi:hypothetical protein